MSNGNTFDVTQAAAYALDVGIDIVAETYNPAVLAYAGIADVVAITATSHPYYGDKSTTLLTDAEPRERADGQQIDAGGAQQGWTPQGKIVPFARKLSIPERVIMAAGVNARNKVGEMTAEFARSFSMSWMDLKNKRFARALTNGAKTAGDASIYDGSFPGNVDPYPKFGYDGQPWFSTAHPLFLSSSTKANHATGAALSSTTFDAARTVMTYTNAVDETDEQITLGLGWLMVPPSLEGTARTILESQNLPGSANNDVNINHGAAQLRVNPFLTDSDAWILFSSSPTVRVMDSGEPSVRTWFNEETRCIEVSCEGHFGLYLRDWRGILGRNLATS